MCRSEHRPEAVSPRLSSLNFAVAAVALAAATLCAPAAAQGASDKSEAYASGRILIMPRAGVPEAALAAILKDHGGGKARRVGKSQLQLVDLPAGLERQTVERLARHPHIKFAELDQVVSEDLATNDPYLGSQWHLPKVEANTAWDLAQGAGVTVAVLDSGIDLKHPDFAGRLVAGYNFVDGNTNVEDVKDHGTKVAGTAAAAMNNGIGVASVAGKSLIMPLRVSNSSGTATFSAIAAALTHAADRGARIANISFNGVAGSSSVLSAAKYMKDKGGLVFVSAGNSNIDPGYANTSNVIIVAATNKSDTKASFSNYGDHVHLSAPGDYIYTTTWGQSYANVAGTSFSAPVAAGVAALVMAANPRLSGAEVEKILFATAVDLGAAGRDIYYGYGRVNAAAAVEAALSTVSAADTKAPTAAISAPLGSSTVSGLVPVNVSVSDNVGVTKVELRANGSLVATDTASPFGFSWDSTKVANGMASLVATAYDAAGNAGQSTAVAVNVANNLVADTTPPTVIIKNPANGSKIDTKVSITVAASDDSGSGALQQTLHIDGKQVASATGGTLSYSWNTRKLSAGTHTIAAVAVDAAGNKTTQSVQVTK